MSRRVVRTLSRVAGVPLVVGALLLAGEAPRVAVAELRAYLEDLKAAVKAAHITYKGNPAAMARNVKLYARWGQHEAWLPLNVARMAMELRMGW